MASPTLRIGETAQIVAASDDAGAPTPVYTSTAPRVATVDHTGLVTALRAGATVVTGTAGPFSVRMSLQVVTH